MTDSIQPPKAPSPRPESAPPQPELPKPWRRFTDAELQFLYGNRTTKVVGDTQREIPPEDVLVQP